MAQPNMKRTADYKLKIVLEALKGDKTLIQLASEHEIHPRQITKWRDKFLEEAKNIFSTQRMQQQDPDKERLVHIINQLTCELEFIKKKLKKNL
jgi:putative transposase